MLRRVQAVSGTSKENVSGGGKGKDTWHKHLMSLSSAGPPASARNLHAVFQPLALQSLWPSSLSFPSSEGWGGVRVGPQFSNSRGNQKQGSRSVLLKNLLCFPYQGLLVLQRPRLHPFLRRRGCGGRHLRAQSSGLPLRLGLRPGLGSRPPAPARVPVLSPQPRQPSAESLRLASRPPRAGRGRSSPRCSARRPGSALGPPPRLQRGGRGRLKLWSSRHLGRGRGLRRGRVCWRVEGPSRVCSSLRRDVRGLGLAGLRAF